MIPASSITTLSSWTQTAFSGTSHPPEQTRPTADPDHDGHCNLCEYAFDGNPTLADLTAPFNIQPATESSLPTITFPITNSATDLTYTIQTSTDGQSWNDTTVFTPLGQGPPPMRSGSPGTIHVSATDQGDGTHLVTERFAGDLSRQIARVKIQSSD